MTHTNLQNTDNTTTTKQNPVHIYELIEPYLSSWMYIDTEAYSRSLISNLAVLNLFPETKNIFAFSIISPSWDGVGDWNPFAWKSKTIVNATTAVDLVTQGANASTTMVLLLWSLNVLISAHESLNLELHDISRNFITIFHRHSLYSFFLSLFDNAVSLEKNHNGNH